MQSDTVKSGVRYGVLLVLAIALFSAYSNCLSSGPAPCCGHGRPR